MPNHYEALTAKCRAMMAHLLGPGDYAELEKKKTVPEAAAFLGMFPPYAAVLAEEDLTRMTRARLEHLLERNLFETYVKLYRFTSGSQRKFFLLLISEFELYYILRAIRSVVSGAMPADMLVPDFLQRHSAIDFGALSAASGPHEIVDAVRGSVFEVSVRRLLLENNAASAIDYAEVENLLYNDHYRELCTRYAASLGGEDGALLRDVIQTKADLTNISRVIRIVRLSEGTGAPPPEYAQIKKYLLTVRKKLRPADIEQLLRRRTAAEIIAYCAKLYPALSGILSVDTADGDYFSSFMSSYAKKLVRRPLPSLMIPFGYLTLREYEIENIVYIIEAIRYQLPPAAMERSIIL